MKTIHSSNNKSFGILFFFVFLILSIWPLKNGDQLNYYLIFISVTFLLLGLINSKLLSPLNKTWIRFGEFLGILIAPVIMALVYFIILTPISLFVRMFGKDLLGLKFLNKQDTYWIKRKKTLGSMRKQF